MWLSLSGYTTRTKIIDGMTQFKDAANEEDRLWQRLSNLEKQCDQVRARIESIRQDMERIVDNVEKLIN